MKFDAKSFSGFIMS